jgi:branched-chain amino acid aminotransferase
MNTPATDSAQAYVSDPRNESVLVYVNGRFVPRARPWSRCSMPASASATAYGKGCGWRAAASSACKPTWTGCTKARARSPFDIGLTREQLTAALFETLAKNGMTDGAHLRLMVTRGVKRTVNQDPRFVIGPPTIVIVAEYKTPRPESKARGLTLFTSTFRTSGPDVFDLRLNSHSRLNLIQALLQAIAAGADEALMLDPRGFVASCNSTNFFIVRGEELWTSTGAYSFKGITQASVAAAWRAAGGTVRECDFTLAQVYSADEAFVTGTLGGVTPVVKVDGRMIGRGEPGPQTTLAGERYLDRVLSDAG